MSEMGWVQRNLRNMWKGLFQAGWNLSAWIYLSLFIIGIFYAFTHATERDGILAHVWDAQYDHGKSKYNDLTRPMYVFLLSAMCATLAHQFFIYLSYHDMEHRRADWAREFPKFFGSKVEISIRIAAFLSLLYASGKLHPVLTVFASQAHVELFRINSMNSEATSLVFGSFLLFGFHLFWDSAAIFSNIRSGRLTNGRPGVVKLFSFFFTDLLGLVISVAVWMLCAGEHSEIADIIIMVLAVLYIILIFIRVVAGIPDILSGRPPAFQQDVGVT